MMKKTVFLLVLVLLSIVMAGAVMSDNDKDNPPGKEKDLLTITEKNLLIDPQLVAAPGSQAVEGGVRVFAFVTNGRATKALNVTAVCTFYLDDKTVYDERTETIEALAPGETKEVLFFFNPKGYAEDYRSKKRVLTVKAD